MRHSSIRALMTQCLALLAVVLLLMLMKQVWQISLSLFPVLLLQGCFAATLAYGLKLDVWWLPIQFFFPLALAGMLSLALPPILYLLLFVALVSLYWSTFRTRVPYFPSQEMTWESVANLLPDKGRPIRMIDIGSGFGGLVMHLSAIRPQDHFMGIEIAPIPYLVSRLRFGSKSGQFVRGDYQNLDFSQFDVVFAYLSPAAMPALWQKAQREMQQGSLLLSYEFPIPQAQPEITTEPDRRNAIIYGWHL